MKKIVVTELFEHAVSAGIYIPKNVFVLSNNKKTKKQNHRLK
jgi:hypothetical protein